MAITNEGTRVSLATVKLPTGYTLPTISDFTDHEYVSDLTLTVLKATVENATDATTLTNIIEDVTIGIDKQIDDILAADFLGSATVTAFTDLLNIDQNITPVNTTDFYNDTAVSYKCTVKLFVKTA